MKNKRLFLTSGLGQVCSTFKIFEMCLHLVCLTNNNKKRHPSHQEKHVKDNGDLHVPRIPWSQYQVSKRIRVHFQRSNYHFLRLTFWLFRDFFLVVSFPLIFYTRMFTFCFFLLLSFLFVLPSFFLSLFPILFFEFPFFSCLGEVSCCFSFS